MNATRDLFVATSLDGHEFTICAGCLHWIRHHSEGCVCCERAHLIPAPVTADA